MHADVDRTLAALADPARRAIVEALRGGAGRPSEVARALSLSRPAMSRHLKVLRGAGLVQQRLLESDARARVLELRPEPFAQLQGWLAEVEGFWTEQLAAFKAHAERGPSRRRR
jgi:DNA-binding transcriptional ArsR family regulator